MRRMLAQLWRYRIRVLIGLFALLAVDLVQIVAPRVLGGAIDRLCEPGNHGEHLLRAALILLLIGLITAVLRFAWRYFLVGNSRGVRRDLRDRRG